MPRLGLRFGSALVACLLVSFTAARAQEYVWRDVVQVVTIGADGAVVVDDTRTLIARGTAFVEAFICVRLEPGQTLTLLAGSGAVSPGPPATAYQQPCQSGGSPGTEVVVRNESSVKERRVRFRYRLEGTLDYHSDVVQWYWQILEADRPVVLGYQVTVRTPGPNLGQYNAYVHHFDNPEPLTVTMNADRSELFASVDHMLSDSAVEVRYLMDPGGFEANGTTPALTRFLRDEAGLTQRSGRTRTHQPAVWSRLWRVLRFLGTLFR